MLPRPGPGRRMFRAGVADLTAVPHRLHVQAGPVFRLHIGSGDDIPVGEATGLSPPSANRSHLDGGTTTMLRLQTPLDERYTAAQPDDLARRIASAKATLGERLFILGHHYQRDEIIRWADARGDSYRLSVLAQQRPQADYIVFCGVHFMAESADILTADHQTVILPDLNAGLLDGRHGRHRRGGGGLGVARRCHRHRPGRARSPT